MKRRKFFETLGAALAGAALIKPDFSQAEEMIKIPVEPDGEFEKPMEDLRHVDFPVGGSLFHGKKKIATFEGISYEYHCDFIDVTSLGSSSDYRLFITGQDDHNVTLLDCKFTPGLKRMYENGDKCKMVIKISLLVLFFAITISIGFYFRKSVKTLFGICFCRAAADCGIFVTVFHCRLIGVVQDF